MTDEAPPAPRSAAPAAKLAPVAAGAGFTLSDASLPDDPGEEILPVARPEPEPATGVPVDWQAQRQQWVGDVVTLTGSVVFHYRGYILRADQVTYNRSTTELEAEGNLQISGGPHDILIEATRGQMRLDNHTARYYNVHGSQGIRAALPGTGHVLVYSSANPIVFSARLAIQSGEDSYRLIDGSITNCRLPRPDWSIFAHSIALNNGVASARNSIFRLFSVPVFDLPWLRHPVDAGSRQSGLLIPVISTGSSIRGYTFGEQLYWAINRSMDLTVGSEYYSRRGWAPNGDFRYRGIGLDHFNAHWNALLDRGYTETTSTGTETVNQGGVDIALEFSRDFSAYTHAVGVAEYLSSYVYRLVFDDNYAQATSSQVSSDVALVHDRNGFVPSVGFQRFETYASTSNGDEVRILHLPNLRYDVLSRPLGAAPVYWSLDSSLSYLDRSEPSFHARNVGRFDVDPDVFYPVHLDGWTFAFDGGLRNTVYTSGQIPDLTPGTGGIPTINHSALNRFSAQAAVDIRPPALERDFSLGSHVLRHVVEPELSYRYTGGIGSLERNVLLFDTSDIVSDTDEAQYTLMQRFYLRRKDPAPCGETGGGSGSACPAAQREWASWLIAQKYFLDPDFGGALIPDRRNVFSTTLDLSAVAFLTRPRNLSPVISRLRFEAIDNLRVEWDLDYDTVRGLLSSDNLYAGYSRGRTTVGIGHALLNAVGEDSGTADHILKSQLLTPFLEIGKASDVGFNVAVHGGYDFDQNTLQYAGIQTAYNWSCCGLDIGYRRYELGSGGNEIRDETQWLYGFTLASFGNVGDIRRANAIFRDPTQPPLY